MFSTVKISDEEKDRRRQLTNFAVKLMLPTGGIALIVELVYYFLVVSPRAKVRFTIGHARLPLPRVP